MNDSSLAEAILKPLLIERHPFPGIYRALLPAEFQWLGLPIERFSDCSNCPQVERGECHEATRCCTYYPQWPNFLVGLALDDPNLKDEIELLIADGRFWPEGLVPTPRRFRVAAIANAKGFFGQLLALRCPFYRVKEGGCSIHNYRNSVCATYFCAHDHGTSGEKLWNSIASLLGNAETAVAQWAMNKEGIDPKAYAKRVDSLANKLGSFDDGERFDESVAKFLWQDRYQDQIAFFKACGQHVLDSIDSLYEIAASQSIVQAFEYEQAIRDSVPEEYRHEVPEVKVGEAMPLSHLWYLTQVAVRRVWELPFGEGDIILRSSDALITDDPHSYIVYHDGKEKTRALTAREANLLALFRNPIALDEAFFERDEVKGVEKEEYGRTRALLSECMRLEVLVLADAKDS